MSQAAVMFVLFITVKSYNIIVANIKMLFKSTISLKL